jgi:ATP-binding cassette subfamily C protein LapB
VLDLVQRIVVIDAGRVVLDGPKQQVLATLAGAPPGGAARPAANGPAAASPAAAAAAAGTAAGSGTAADNVHRHPATQPVQRAAAV